MLKALFARPDERPVELTTEKEISDVFQQKTGSLWVDLESPTEEERGILSRVFGFHKIAIENCIAQSNHPRSNDYGDYLYLVFHAVSVTVPSTPAEEKELFVPKLKEETEPRRGGRVQFQEIDAFLGVNFLVTYHAGAESAIENERRKCLEVATAMKRGPDRVLAEILDNVVEGFIGVMEGLDEQINRLEDRLFRRPTRTALREIFTLKKDVLHLRRVVNPQREVLNRLARAEHKAVSPEEAIFFRDVYDHLYRFSEMLESFRDVITGALEVYLTVVTYRTNEIMKVLTVFSIVLMSVTFIAGLYGMNVKLPFDGFRYAFYLVLVMMGALSGVLVFLFRKRKWI